MAGAWVFYDHEVGANGTPLVPLADADTLRRYLDRCLARYAPTSRTGGKDTVVSKLPNGTYKRGTLGVKREWFAKKEPEAVAS